MGGWRWDGGRHNRRCEVGGGRVGWQDSSERRAAPAAATATKLPPHPDYEARRKRIWGDRVFTQEEVDEMRAFETGEP